MLELLQKRFFLIKWKGYSVEESTWEPEKNLNCPAIIAKYNSKITSSDARRAIESTDDEYEHRNADNKKKLKSRRSSSVVMTSPSSAGSLSPSRPFYMASPPRDSVSKQMMNKPQGIAQFFKPTSETLPALNSDDLVKLDRVSHNLTFYFISC